MKTVIMSSSDFQVATGARLRRLISLLDLYYTDAAEIMGVSRHVLNHWMVGNNPIQPHALYRLCRSRGVDFNYVFLGDWSGLPFPLAAALDAEVRAELDQKQVSAPTDADAVVRQGSS